MGGVVKKVFGGGKPKVDPTIAENQRRQQARLDAREAAADKRIESRRRSRRGGTGARALLANREAPRGLASTLGSR